jgi:hypothetical protein
MDKIRLYRTQDEMSTLLRRSNINFTTKINSGRHMLHNILLNHPNHPTMYCTVGAKSITCVKSITRYDINGQNIAEFLNFFYFLFFLLPTECKNNNFKKKIRIFFLRICYDRPKKIILFYRHFFPPPVFLPLFNFQRCQFVFEESLYT